MSFQENDYEAFWNLNAHLVPIFRESGIWFHEFSWIIRFHVIFWLPELASLKVDIRCGSGSEKEKMVEKMRIGNEMGKSPIVLTIAVNLNLVISEVLLYNTVS